MIFEEILFLIYFYNPALYAADVGARSVWYNHLYSRQQIYSPLTKSHTDCVQSEVYCLGFVCASQNYQAQSYIILLNATAYCC